METLSRDELGDFDDEYLINDNSEGESDQETMLNDASEDFDIGFSPNTNFGEEGSEGLSSTGEGLQNDVDGHVGTGTTGGDESFDEGLVKHSRTVQLGDTLPGPVTVPIGSNNPPSRDSRRARAPKSKFKGTDKPLPEAVPFVTLEKGWFPALLLYSASLFCGKEV